MADVGAWMVDNLYQQLMVDDHWAIRRERGFTWWGYRLAQHIEVAPPVHDRGLDLCALRIWTEVVENVDPHSGPADVLAQINSQATLSALVWDPEAATITECCTATVHQDNAGWMSKILATAAVLQNTAAHSRAHGIAKTCGGNPAQSQHPVSGERPQMDDILSVPERVIVPMGREPSRFIGEPCRSLDRFLVEYASQMHWFGNVDDTGGSVEVPFAGATPIGFQDPADPNTRLETGLVRVFTDAPHPEAGNGALLVAQLPVSPGLERAALTANDLNLAEMRGGVNAPPLLGSWCPDFLSDNGNGLAFCSFLPNLLAAPNILNNWVLYQRTRSLWAHDFLTN